MAYYFGKGTNVTISPTGRREPRRESPGVGRKYPVPGPFGDGKRFKEPGTETQYCEGAIIARNNPPYCPEGYTLTEYPDGTARCCPGGGTTGEECAGGYRLTDNPIAPGGGSLWTDEIIKPEHGWYRDPGAAGHWIWHRDYGYQYLEDVYNFIQQGTALPQGATGACAKGYQPKEINGETWCCPEAGGGGAGGGGGGGELGWWDWPEDMKEFYRQLMERGTGLLNMPLGYTPEMMASWFGRDFSKIRGMETPYREDLLRTLGREGMLGTGEALTTMGKSAWDVERSISDLTRDLFMAGEEKKKQDLLDYTNLAQTLFGQGMGYNQLIEILNAARRGEGERAMNMLLELLGMLMWR